MTVFSARGRHRGQVLRFALLHAAALLVFVVPFRWSLVGWLAGSYLVRMFGITAGYHRYFSHRSYKLGRVAQAAMAFLAQTSGQKSVLWWAAHHRDHHRYADTPADVHSPCAGFWWAHAGWVLSTRYDALYLGYCEAAFLERHIGDVQLVLAKSATRRVLFDEPWRTGVDDAGAVRRA